MNNPKKIEFLANLGIILVAVVLGVVLVTRFLLPASQKPEPATAERITLGTKLSLPGLDWGKGSQTLLLVLSTNCRYCTESTPFYQRLVQLKAERSDVRLVAVLPQIMGEAEKYLMEHGVKVDEIRQATPINVHARGTPTLILTDKSGSVVESWMGKLPPEKEAEVLKLFLGAHIGS